MMAKKIQCTNGWLSSKIEYRSANPIGFHLMILKYDNIFNSAERIMDANRLVTIAK